MFGFGKKKEENKTNSIVVVNKTETDHFYEEYPIRYIFLTDLQNYKIDGVDLYLGSKNVSYVTSPTWAHYGVKERITLYFLFESDNGGLGFQYQSITNIDNQWVFDDGVKTIKFCNDESKIKYKNIGYEVQYSDGSKNVIRERVVDEILLNRYNAPIHQGPAK